MVALAGFSGLVPETALLALGQAPAELPPGLYMPSADHLVHALSSGNKFVAPPEGSETDYALPPASLFQPQFFSREEFQVVTSFVKIILGNVPEDALSQSTQWIDL